VLQGGSAAGGMLQEVEYAVHLTCRVGMCADLLLELQKPAHAQRHQPKVEIETL